MWLFMQMRWASRAWICKRRGRGTQMRAAPHANQRRGGAMQNERAEGVEKAANQRRGWGRYANEAAARLLGGRSAAAALRPLRAPDATSGARRKQEEGGGRCRGCGWSWAPSRNRWGWCGASSG